MASLVFPQFSATRPKATRNMTHRLVSAPLLLTTLLLACTPATPASPPVAAPAPAPTVEPAAPAETSEKPPSAVTILADIGLQTPESVYFDKRRDVYLVSNINGTPTDVDGNGFITRLTPQGDGEYKIELKFIDGARKGSLLNAPKGLTVAGDVLYVADIDRVRKFDALTGAPKGEIVLKGATFINDLATGENGYIYASDSGLSPKFEGTGTDAVYMISPQDDVRKLISGAELGNPNGVLATPGGVWVVTFGSGELYWVSDTGERKSVQALPQGKNDGVVFTNKGELLVSSWAASAVFSGEPERDFKTKISGVTSPADIGYDCTRDRVLIPLYKEDKVVIQQLDK
jgi:sugar lactone lactonase YvrE